MRLEVRTSLLVTTLLTGLGAAHETPAAEFTLRGGHFFGPGPIEPDAALPDGKLVNIRFDRARMEGVCEFKNDDSPAGRFSDGRTRINQNIDAGLIKLGDGRETVRLAAVDGGPNQGHEYYYLDDHYNLVWRVDLALDPGFDQGIIRVDNFHLTTGVVQIPPSMQSQRREPGGYDQAGSLKSGRYLAGRVGDFDGDGRLDGVLVAAPNVPMEAGLLPGAPVGNQRGFETDVELPAHLAAELALRGIKNFQAPLQETVARPDLVEFRRLIEDVGQRLHAARRNMETALLRGRWKEQALRPEGMELTWRIDALELLQFMTAAFTNEIYKYPNGRPPAGAVDALTRFFEQLDHLLTRVAAQNAKTGDTLPARPKGTTGGATRGAGL